MTNHNSLKPTLIELAKLQIELAQKGGATKDGELYERTVEIQEDILNSFGLPTSSENEELVWFNTPPTDTEVDERINLLHKSAATYLLSNVKSELQTLRDAQEFNQDPFTVLPELKIANHVYTLFVFNEILLKRKDTLENILHELKLTTQYDILNTLGGLALGTLKDRSTIIDNLKAVGAKYIDQYVMVNSSY